MNTKTLPKTETRLQLAHYVGNGGINKQRTIMKMNNEEISNVLLVGWLVGLKLFIFIPKIKLLFRESDPTLPSILN